MDEGWLPELMGKRNKHGIPWVLMVLFWLMALIPNLFGLNIGQLISLASAVTLIPMLIPVWGFVKLPECDPEGWNASKMSTTFASKGSPHRAVRCLHDPARHLRRAERPQIQQGRRHLRVRLLRGLRGHLRVLRR